MKVREVHWRTAWCCEPCEYVGEVMENSDWACIINLEEKKDDKQLYLSFSRVKMRYKPSKRTTFSHPFNIDNTMMLMDDIGLDNSLSVDYIGSDFTNDLDIDGLMKKKKKMNIDDIIESDIANGDNGIFDFGSAINGKK